MRKAAIIAAIARAHGRFEESWGGPFDPFDSHDIEGLSYLIATELSALVHAEVKTRVDAEMGKALEAWRAALWRGWGEGEGGDDG